jgi:hypothetical protein
VWSAVTTVIVTPKMAPLTAFSRFQRKHAGECRIQQSLDCRVLPAAAKYALAALFNLFVAIFNDLGVNGCSSHSGGLQPRDVQPLGGPAGSKPRSTASMAIRKGQRKLTPLL